MTRSALPPLPRLGFLCLATLLLSSCPRAGVLPYGVEVSGEGEALIYSVVKSPVFQIDNQIIEEERPDPFFKAVQLALSTLTPDAEIHYESSADPLVSPLQPTIESARYTSPLVLDGYREIRAAAFINSSVASGTVPRIFAFSLPKPTLNSSQDPQIPGALLVTIEMSVAGAQIIYANNKASNSALNTTYTPGDAIQVSDGYTLRAQAKKTGWASSEIVSISNLVP